MNRNMTEIGSSNLPRERQKEVAHRYMLGLYRIMETITSEFPEILFESCSGGGGRFDGGMLYYMPQTWASDDTDAIERLKIQYGTSLVYPTVTMGSHVSEVPNHQVGRITPLSTRAAVAMEGSFGYELDINKMTSEEKEEVKKQVEFYKEIRQICQFGDLYRLKNTFDGNLRKDGERFLSTKRENNELHGIGIKNVIKVVEKYDGFYLFEPEGDEFSAIVIIPMDF